MHTFTLARLTSMYNQLSVENAMARSAVATIAEMVARDNVTAEQGIFTIFTQNAGKITIKNAKPKTEARETGDFEDGVTGEG